MRQRSGKFTQNAPIEQKQKGQQNHEQAKQQRTRKKMCFGSVTKCVTAAANFTQKAPIAHEHERKAKKKHKRSNNETESTKY